MTRARMYGILISIFLIVIVTLLLITSPVQADTGVTTDDPQTETTPTLTETTPIAETTPITETTPAIETTPTPTTTEISTEETPVESTPEPVVDPSLTTDPTVEPTDTVGDATAEEQLVDVLVANDLLLTDSEGNAIPLATEAGSAAAEASDPYFMAGGVYYGYTTTGICAPIVLPANCTTVPTNPIQAALTAYGTTVGATGAIYLEAGTYSLSSNLNISTLPTLKGLIGADSSTTTLNFSAGTGLQVSNTTLGFTLQGLTINGNVNSASGQALVDFNNNTGALLIQDVVVQNLFTTNGDGIEITNQTGNVTLNKVQSTKNRGTGATITSTGNVTINNSEFDMSSYENGLTVTSTGAIVMNGVSVSENYNGGAVLQAQKGITIKDSLFEYNMDAYGGTGNGLSISTGTTGTITLNNVYANYNDGSNIYLDQTNGAVVMNNIEAIYPQSGYGIFIDNCIASGGICSSTINGNVTLTNINVNAASLTNLYVHASGAITVSGLIADSSYFESSAYLDNHDAKAVFNVSVANADVSYSQNSGLVVLSRGSVTLNHIESRNSYDSTDPFTRGTGTGIWIENTYGTGSVTILNTLGDNYVSRYGNNGVTIYSKGSVTINQLELNRNDDASLNIINYQGSGSVTVKNVSVYTYNATNGGGIYISSHGAVSLTNIETSYAYDYGVFIDNRGPVVTPVTMTNVSIYYGYGDGLIVYSRGSITLSGIDSYDNQHITAGSYWGGVHLDNMDGTAGITINNSYSTDNHFGWNIRSNGNVLMNGISASNNTTMGVAIDNRAPTASPTVTIKFGYINDNEIFGIWVLSKGTITLVSTEVHENNTSHDVSGFGAVLDNSGGTGGIVMTGTATAINRFNNNYESDGVTIRTKGTVNINYIDTLENDLMGIRITDTGTGAVTVSNITSYGNEDVGVYVVAKGSITINNPMVTNNLNNPTDPYDAGVYLNNLGGSGSVTVQRTVTPCGYYADKCEINNNFISGDTGGVGLEILSNGSVTLKYLFVGNSTDGGILIDNSGGTGAVSFTDISTNYNHASGIDITTRGTVTLTKIETYGNDGFGLKISDTGTGAVTITTISAEYNDEAGVYVEAKGSITVNNPFIQYNLDKPSYSYETAGIYLDNSTGTGSVTVQRTTTLCTPYDSICRIYNNGYYTDTTFHPDQVGVGIKIKSTGNVTVKNVDISYSPNGALYIDNSYGLGTVTVTSVNSQYNGGSGVEIDSKGAVTVNAITTHNNVGYGLKIVNNSVTGKNVTASNVESYGNNFDGVYIQTGGSVMMAGIDSYENFGSAYGLYVDTLAGTGGITLTYSGTNTNNISQNPWYGLEFLTNGSVVINKTVVYNNGHTGIRLNNPSSTGSVTLNTVESTYAAVGEGIYIRTKGNVNLTNIITDSNQLNGIDIVNSTGTGSVTITNAQGGGSYTSSGIVVISNGAITLTKVTSDSNDSGWGAYLDNSGATTGTPGITVQNTSPSINSFYNNKYGLEIHSKGIVTITNTEVTSTDYAAVLVNNTYGTAAVTMTNVTGESYSRNGISIATKGAVTGTKLYGRGSSEYVGVIIDNCQWNGAVCSGSGNVTLTTVTGENSGTGLYVYSNGNIVVSNLTAQSNYNSLPGSYGYGAYLSNINSSATPSISVLKGLANSNEDTGIYILTKGSVTLDGINASNNYTSGSSGVYVNNTGGTGNVTILTTKGPNVFSGNGGEGLRIITMGAISAANITARDNSFDGLYLRTGGLNKAITLNTVTVIANGYDGIDAVATAASTFTNIRAINNGYYYSDCDGVKVDTTGHNFTIINSFLSGNGNNGLDATVGGTSQTVRVLNTFYFGNGRYGSADAPNISTDGKLSFV